MALRIIFSVFWIILALIALLVWHSISYEDPFTFKINGVDKTASLGFVYLVFSVLLFLIAVGVFIRSRLSLLIIIPIFGFSTFALIDEFTSELVLLKYIICYGAFIFASFGSLIVVCRRTS